MIAHVYTRRGLLCRRHRPATATYPSLTTILLQYYHQDRDTLSLEASHIPWLALLRASLARAAVLSVLCPLVLADFGGSGDDTTLASDVGTCTFQASLTTVHGAPSSPLAAAAISLDLDSVLRLVVSTEHDVRVAAIKGVRKCLKKRRGATSVGTTVLPPSASLAATFKRLDAALSASLESETYAPSQRRLLHSLGMVRAELRASGGPLGVIIDGGEESDDGEAQEWALLERLFVSGRRGGGDSAVAAMALEAMGWALLRDRQRYADRLRAALEAQGRSLHSAARRVAPPCCVLDW